MRPVQSIFSLAFSFFFIFFIFSSKLLTLCTGNRCPKIYSICRSKFRPFAVPYTLAISKFMFVGIIQDGIHNNSATNFCKIISFWLFNILILASAELIPAQDNSNQNLQDGSPNLRGPDHCEAMLVSLNPFHRKHLFEKKLNYP